MCKRCCAHVHVTWQEVKRTSWLCFLAMIAAMAMTAKSFVENESCMLNVDSSGPNVLRSCEAFVKTSLMWTSGIVLSVSVMRKLGEEAMRATPESILYVSCEGKKGTDSTCLAQGVEADTGVELFPL